MILIANRTRRPAFTLVEVLVVVAVIAVLAALLLPALTKARERGLAIVCLNNTRQLDAAAQLYSDDHESALPYNLGMSGSSFRTNLNWVNNVMTWGVSGPMDSDNTNLATIKEAALGSYVNGSTAIYRCPSDHVMSAAQSAAGWNGRIRSYSMNALVGNAGPFVSTGVNVNDPSYKQFFKTTQIQRPSEIFVFLDEHPDSIDDGYFVNKESPASSSSSSGYGSSITTTPATTSPEWTDLPGSYHNRAAAFSFADGHSSLHRWSGAKVVRPAQPYTANLPMPLSYSSGQNSDSSSSADLYDFQWVMSHMSTQN